MEKKQRTLCNPKPTPIPRCSEEEKKEYDMSLGWDAKKKYIFPTKFNEKGSCFEYNKDDNGSPLPEPLKEVLNTFCTTLDKRIWNQDKWEISWNEYTPALQFTIKNNDPIKELLPKENIFHCQYVQDTKYYSVCESISYSSDIIEQTLYDQKPEFWTKNFSTYTVLYPLGEYTIDEHPNYVILTSIKHPEIIYKKMFVTPIKKQREEQRTKFINEAKEGKYKTQLVGKDFPVKIILEEEKEKKEEDSITIEKIRKDAVEYLGTIYKIRLQCKPEYQIWCVNKLINLFSDEPVGRLISTFKCSLVYSKIQKNEGLASIIIYVNHGKNTALTLLKILIKEFEGCEKVGLDITPRFNHKYNSLIYWSGGDGDTKEKLIKEGLADKYLDSTTVPKYAHFKGYHLDPKEEIKSTR